MPISVSSGHFALRYEVPKFLPRGGAFMYGCAYHSSGARSKACAGVDAGMQSGVGGGRADSGRSVARYARTTVT